MKLNVRTCGVWVGIDYGMSKLSSDNPLWVLVIFQLSPTLHDLKLVLEAALMCLDSLILSNYALNFHICVCICFFRNIR